MHVVRVHISPLTWIVFRRVRNQVVNVVMVLPPADGNATEKVGDENADVRVLAVGMRDGQVTGVVRRECQLMPEGTEEYCR